MSEQNLPANNYVQKTKTTLTLVNNQQLTRILTIAKDEPEIIPLTMHHQGVNYERNEGVIDLLTYQLSTANQIPTKKSDCVMTDARRDDDDYLLLTHQQGWSVKDAMLLDPQKICMAQTELLSNKQIQTHKVKACYNYGNWQGEYMKVKYLNLPTTATLDDYIDELSQHVPEKLAFTYYDARDQKDSIYQQLIDQINHHDRNYQLDVRADLASERDAAYDDWDD